MSFWESAFLWKEAVIASSACAAVLSVIGMYTVLRRVVFLPSALSQVSGLGVILSFLAAAKFTSLEGSAVLDPFAWALVLSLIAALLLGRFRERASLSRETLIGIVFVASAAAIAALSAKIPQESHAVEDVLFGNAVMVSSRQMMTAVGLSAVVLVCHALLFRPFVFISMDPETARAQGLPVNTLDAVLFLSMGLAIAEAVKTIGALPVFAYTVLPPSAALRLFPKTAAAFIGAPFIGAASAFLGYYFSFTRDLPTGACTALTAAVFFAAAVGIDCLRRYRTPRR